MYSLFSFPQQVTGKLNLPRLPRPAQNQLQCIRRLSFGLVDGVDVAVSGFELGMSEAGGYVLYVRAV